MEFGTEFGWGLGGVRAEFGGVRGEFGLHSGQQKLSKVFN